MRNLHVLFKMIRTEQELLHSVSFTWILTMMFRIVLLADIVQLHTMLIEFMLCGVWGLFQFFNIVVETQTLENTQIA